MTDVNKAIELNKAAATSAAFLEAGRIANNQLTKVASKKLPIVVRGYADHPLGKLVIANLAAMAAQHFRGDDANLKKLTSAMTVQAYQELIQTVDIEGIIDELLESKEVKRALSKLDKGE